MHVDIWQIDLSETDAESAAFAVLDDTERLRAARFVAAEHRRRYVLARAALRVVLGDKLASAPADVGLGAAPGGKPILHGGGDRVGFNVSHSQDVALIAIGPPVAIGIDLEALAPMPEGLAQRYFAPPEVAALMMLSGAAQDEAFTRIWTRKEAVVKAIGAGLHAPLDGFVVPISKGSGLRLVDCAMQPDLIDRLQLHECPAPAGFCASLAIDAGIRSVSLQVTHLPPLAQR